MYQIGDKIVHPMHGAGVISDIVRERRGGVLYEYYTLRLPSGGMLVMIPVGNCAEIGVRAICTREYADTILASIPALDAEITPNWNQRYRENMQRIKSGDLTEVTRVVKALARRDAERALSTGERKMLHTAKQILVSELALAWECEYTSAEARINEVLLQ